MLCRSWILPNLVDVSTTPHSQGYPSGTRYAISAEDAKANNKNKNKKAKEDKKIDKKKANTCNPPSALWTPLNTIQREQRRIDCMMHEG